MNDSAIQPELDRRTLNEKWWEKIEQSSGRVTAPESLRAVLHNPDFMAACKDLVLKAANEQGAMKMLNVDLTTPKGVSEAIAIQAAAKAGIQFLDAMFYLAYPDKTEPQPEQKDTKS